MVLLKIDTGAGQSGRQAEHSRSVVRWLADSVAALTNRAANIHSHLEQADSRSVADARSNRPSVVASPLGHFLHFPDPAAPAFPFPSNDLPRSGSCSL